MTAMNLALFGFYPNLILSIIQSARLSASVAVATNAKSICYNALHTLQVERRLQSLCLSVCLWVSQVATVCLI